MPVADAELVKAYRADALFNAHRDDPEFGYGLLADEARDSGLSMADRTVAGRSPASPSPRSQLPRPPR